MQRRLFQTTLVASTLALAAVAAMAQGKGDIKIAIIASKTGPLEAYAKQTITGFQMGLDYATGGTMTVAGKKLVVIEKDDQGKPDVGKAQLAAAYGDDKVDIAVGPTASPVALAMLPVAEEYKRILLVEPAVADSITGDKWNKYIFRTGRNSSQDAIANAAAQRMTHIRSQATAKNKSVAQQILNELQAAETCLLHAQQRARYDQHLRQAMQRHKEDLAKQQQIGGASLTAPSRYVRVFSDGDKYFFESLPVVLIEDSYYLDVYGVMPAAQAERLHPRGDDVEWRVEREHPGIGGRVLRHLRAVGAAHPRALAKALGAGATTSGWGGSSSASTRALDMLQYRGLARVVRREAGIRVYGPSAERSRAEPPSHRARTLLETLLRLYAPLPEGTLRQLARMVGGRGLDDAGRERALARFTADAAVASGTVEPQRLRPSLRSLPYDPHPLPPFPAGTRTQERSRSHFPAPTIRETAKEAATMAAQSAGARGALWNRVFIQGW